MATDLGKVGMVMRGDYNASATYEALDVVSYQNEMYVAKKNVPINTNPTNSTYWQLAISEMITDTFTTSSDTGNGSGGRLSLTANVSKSGYTPIGIISIQPSSNEIVLVYYFLDGNTANVSFRNYSGTSVTASATIKVLYKKN